MTTIDPATLAAVTGGTSLPPGEFAPSAESAPGINLAERLKAPEPVKGGLADFLRTTNGDNYYPAQGE